MVKRVFTAKMKVTQEELVAGAKASDGVGLCGNKLIILADDSAEARIMALNAAIRGKSAVARRKKK